jgi:PAS domain S-box-containing protein
LTVGGIVARVEARMKERADRRERSPAGWQHPELLPLLVDSIEDYAMYALDADGNVATWNTGAQSLMGYTAEEILGQPFSVFYCDDAIRSDAPEEELAIAVADGHLQEEGWRVRKDGSTFWASVLLTSLRGGDGRLLGFGEVTRDLTERRRAEQLLRESEERFRLLVNSVADYAIFLLEPDGRISSWNLGAERLKGYRADEVIGRHFSLFYPADDVRQGVPQRLLATALKDRRVESEGWRIRKNGSRFWASVVITALHGPDGTHRGFAKVTKDLTDRKRSEDALRGVLERERESADRLRQLDRMRTGVFEVVAHDLRSPLTVIQNLTYVLQTGWDDLSDEAKRDHLARIAARTSLMNELVEDLFDVMQVDAGQLEVEQVEFDVGEIITTAIADSVPAATASRVRSRFVEDRRAIGDPRRTRQVVVNLLTNAAKFSAPDEPIDIIVERESGGVSVAVVDRGVGVPLDEQHLLFQRFSRLTSGRETPGSGIGLFIARSLVEAQHGQITVDSAPGQGSTFRFTLPAAP